MECGGRLGRRLRRDKARAAISKLVSGEPKPRATQGRAAKDSHLVRLAARLALANIASNESTKRHVLGLNVLDILGRLRNSSELMPESELLRC